MRFPCLALFLACPLALLAQESIPGIPKPAAPQTPLPPAGTVVKPTLPHSATDPSKTLAPASPDGVPAAGKPEFQYQPTWETQKLAQTYLLTIPAPRGEITDRHGTPLAQSVIAHNLAINFPTPPTFSEIDARRFIVTQLNAADRVLGRTVTIDIDKALKHYKNRAVLPLVIALDLKEGEVEQIRSGGTAGLVLQPVYQRIYPLGTSAAHIVGYVGRQGRYGDGPIEPNEMLWPPSEGREGLELTFNEQLSGKNGIMQISFDHQGKKAAEKVLQAPLPGQNVITTLDLKIQKMVEASLVTAGRPAAMVMIDSSNGEILAMASTPTYNPNRFIPTITQQQFEVLNTDPNKPLIPRAFRASYPPGSTFKIITGLAAMNTGAVDPEDAFGGESSIDINGKTFRNWKSHDVGPLNFVEALTQSCNTYFYRMGLKTGPQPIYEYATRLGFGSKTGIPINGEDDGNIMTTDYLLKKYKRRFMPGDTANLSIGQGDTLVTPLQLAGAMAAVGNGGTVLQIRLVLQVQNIENKITAGYDVRAREHIEIDPTVLNALKEGLVGVVSSRSGTAGRASVPNVQVAGKTGTAQWGSGKNEKVAAWFSGFVPAARPKYAFAALYEGVPGDDDVHGGTNAAPIVGRVLKELYKDTPKAKKAIVKRRVEAYDVDEEPEEEPDPEQRPRRRRTPDDPNFRVLRP